LVADPDKYFKKALAQGIVYENIQTACPVTGKPIDTSFVTNYEGRRIYFASKEAIVTFSQDPAKYLAILDEQSKAKDEKDHSSKREDGEHKH
jgi:YHS domain-containing protein